MGRRHRGRPRTPELAAPREPTLRRLDGDFEERRFEPASGKRELGAVVAMSVGALAIGAGIYGQYFWNDPRPYPYAPYILGLGVALVALYVLFGTSSSAPLVVGELGVGFDREGRVARIPWYDLRAVTLTQSDLLLETPDKPVKVPLGQHGPAARRIVSEALKRIPKRVRLADDDVHRLGNPSSREGTRQSVEPPQVTEHTCAASNRPLRFEKDVRMCAFCGALYHRAAVPRRCLHCNERLVDRAKKSHA